MAVTAVGRISQTLERQRARLMPALPFRKKTTTLAGLAGDTLALVRLRANPLAIWFGKRMDPALREEIMVAVARTNECRYCIFAHSEWAGLVGVSDEELARLEGEHPEKFDRRKWLALSYARALAQSNFTHVPEELRVELARTFDPVEIKDIETVARVMAMANLSGNTVDAFLARLGGAPIAASRLADELAIVGGFLAVAALLVPGFAVAERKSPLEILSKFFRVSDAVEGRP